MHLGQSKGACPGQQQPSPSQPDLVPFTVRSPRKNRQVESNGPPRAPELCRASKSHYIMSEVKTNIPLSISTVLNRANLPLWQVFSSPPQSNLQLPDFKSSAGGNFAPAIAPQRLLSSLQRCQMSGGDACCSPAAWTADEQRWYADLVVQCTAPKQSRAAINVPRVLGQLESMPLDECVQMRGKATLQGRLEDSDHVLWSHDRHGRWVAKIDGQRGTQTLWLGRKLARLRHGRAPVASGLKASHNCGHKGCVRWQHLRFQSSREDVLDREHHELHPGVLRPELRALFVPYPEVLTPNQSARYRSPATSVDLP